MCGRYDLNENPAVIQLCFELGILPELRPRYNIAPGQSAPVVRPAEDGGRALAMLRWGLIPFWAKDEKIGYRTINARAETVATAPAFRAAFKKRRCIVPASGFFEWKTLADGKRPYRIKPADAPLFGFAGLWEVWRSPGGEPIESYSIITTEANELVRTLHTRMPVILVPEQYGEWLTADAADVGALLRPYTADCMCAYPVSNIVNNARVDEPGCIEPAAEAA